MNTERRTTRQRTAVKELLDGTREFLTAQQVHAALRQGGNLVGLATVYRALQTMAEADEVDALRTADGEIAYRRCSRGHHHHLVCRSCGTTVEIAASQVEAWASTVAAEHGFTNVSHDLELFGTCSECAA